MKIERISENQIRCTLNKNDLVDRELRISELAYGTEKAKALFRDMMQQASYELGTRAAIIREGRIIACDSVEALSKTNTKRVTIHGNIQLNESDTIRNLEKSNDTMSFLYNGEIKQLLRTLSEAEITDISISEPDLEEIFLHYYENKK